MKTPKIVSGFFFSKDDMSMLDDLIYFRKLLHLGNIIFQVEIDSLYNDDFLIGKKDQSRIEKFLDEFPSFYTDKFNGIPTSPKAEGIFFNLAYTDHPNYTYPNSTYKASQIKKLFLLNRNV